MAAQTAPQAHHYCNMIKNQNHGSNFIDVQTDLERIF